jgi:hypothetical protein
MHIKGVMSSFLTYADFEDTTFTGRMRRSCNGQAGLGVVDQSAIMLEG